MENKVLIKLLLPELNDSYDLFIPVNETVYKIKTLNIKAISELNGIELNKDINYILINKDNCREYTNNELIINTFPNVYLAKASYILLHPHFLTFQSQ